MAAYSLHRSPTPLGNYLRRMKSKLGPKAATTATAHKIAVIFYLFAAAERRKIIGRFCSANRRNDSCFSRSLMRFTCAA